MKYYQWTIGSTSVRNPDRLRGGLKILKETFEDKQWNLQSQEKYFELLKETGIYEMEESDYAAMTAARKQEHARKWVSVLNQLGFCFAYESSGKSVIITNAGKSLLDNPEIEDEIFLRQLLKYQKPCALPKQSGPSFEKVSVLPFILSLNIVYKLQGLSKEEISIFLNTTISMNDIGKTIKQIQEYRSRRDQIEGRVKKREYYFKTQLSRLEEVFSEELNERISLIKKLISGYKKNHSFLSSKQGKQLLADITRGGKGSNTIKAKRAQLDIIEAIKSGRALVKAKEVFLNYYLPLKIATLRDYADLTVRYLRKSGLFSVSRDKLITITEKEDLIKSLLSQKWELIENKKYLDYFWSDSLPILPSDKIDYLKEYLTIIKTKEKALFDKAGIKESMSLVGEKIIPGKDISQLKQQIKTIERNVLYLKEIEFYCSQSGNTQIDDIINFYDLILNRQILGGEAYYPAYLEWNTWRLFLAIDTLSNKPYEARRFKLDDELQPIDHAPGNGADMVFEYDNFILVAEVTLTVRANQWSAEAEPVPRHVARVQSDNKEKNVFGIFVAPQIDPNTILTFFKHKHVIKDEMIDLTIIPFTIDQIKSFLLTFRQKRFSVQNMRRLFETVKSEMLLSKDAFKWYKKIPEIINNWTKEL